MPPIPAEISEFSPRAILPPFQNHRALHMNDNSVNTARRRFLTGVTAGVGAVGAAGAAVPFVASMSPSERARAAGAPVEVDISRLGPGQILKVEWRGKAVFVVNRTPEMLASLAEVEPRVADPESAESLQPDYARNRERSLRPEVMVVVGVCTHLGCAPLEKFQTGPQSGVEPDWRGGFYCPCHGSKFDLAGRVYKGVPAPTNMEVPPYRFVDENRILIGVHHGAEVA